MKFVSLSDIHLVTANPVARKDNILDTQNLKLEYAFEFAADTGSSILQAGDFPDSPRSWHLLPMLIRMIQKHGVQIFGVYGQHDTYLYSEELRHATTLGVLNHIGLINIVDDEPYEAEPGTFITGVSFGGEVPKPVEGADLNILVIHKGISNAPLWPGHKYTKASSFLKKHKYDFILCGDIHKKFINRSKGRIICNTGPMLRIEATDEMLTHKPGFYVYDTEDRSIQWEEIPHLPSSEVLSRDHIESRLRAEEAAEEFSSGIKQMLKEDGYDFVTDKDKYSFIDTLHNIIQSGSLEDEITKILIEIAGEIDDTRAKTD